MLEQIVTPLLAWYDGHARILPWRENPTPYRVWVSEIMLQQTRVEAVRPYYERFMTSLPGIPELAKCPEDRLLKLWEGLGYYNRVRNLQKAARILMEQYEGEMPGSYEAVIALPGIGSYTAGAILSIAFGESHPAVDGNVLRVISRVTFDEADVLKQSVKKRMEKVVQAIMPEKRPGDFNQALMELGATVCVPNGQPKCGECPLAGLCEAHRRGKEVNLPKKTPKKPRKIENRTVLIIREGDRTAIQRRPEKGLLAGLYELPNLLGHLSSDEVLGYLRRQNLSPIRIMPLAASNHIFSHVEWHMVGYAVRVEEIENEKINGWLFVEPDRTERDYPIPAAFSAYTDYLDIHLGQEKYDAAKNRRKNGEDL